MLSDFISKNKLDKYSTFPEAKFQELHITMKVINDIKKGCSIKNSLSKKVI